MSFGKKVAVSVVVPVYNGEAFAARCVACFKSQTLREIEVLFVDDRSEDRTADFIEREIAGDDRFRLIRQPVRTDPLRCRREGVLASSGEYLMFLDIDDELVPEACEKALGIIRREATDLFVFGTQVVPAEGVSESETAGCQRFLDREPRHGRVDITEEFLPKLFKAESWSPSVWNKIVRADILRDIYRDFRPAGYLGYGQDFLQTILVFLSIRSLFSDVGLRLHRYHLGTGASVRAKGALTWDRFVRIMSSSNTAKALSEYLAGREDISPSLRRKIEGRFVSNFRNNAARYVGFLSEDNLSRGIDLAVRSWGPSLFETPSFRSDALQEILDVALQSPALRLPNRTIRTVGFFFPGKRDEAAPESVFACNLRMILESRGIRTFFLAKEEFDNSEDAPPAPGAAVRSDRWRHLVGRHAPDFVFLMAAGNGNSVLDALVLRSLGVGTASVFPRGTKLAKIGSLKFLRSMLSAVISGRAICLDQETESETAPWLGFAAAFPDGDEGMGSFPWNDWLSAQPATGALRNDSVRAARYDVLRNAAAFELRKATAAKKAASRQPAPPTLAARIRRLLFRADRRIS